MSNSERMTNDSVTNDTVIKDSATKGLFAGSIFFEHRQAVGS